ncbi:MAG: flavin reductase family protein [Pseudonocardiaceae bacterium]
MPRVARWLDECGVSPSTFRDAMARFPTGVAIVTTHDEGGRPYGFTASSFCSVSLDPPLVLVCLARSARSYPVFARNQSFAISVLQSTHVEFARRFASKIISDRFAPGGFIYTLRGSIVLEEALAVVECSVDSRHEAGDHVIMVGEVDQVSLAEQGKPVVYFDRGFRTLCSASCRPQA